MPGPNFPTAAVDGGGGTSPWTAPTNAETADGLYASNAIVADGGGDPLNTSGYGFAVTGVVTQILVEVLCHGHITVQSGPNAGTQIAGNLNCSLLNVTGAGTILRSANPTTDTWLQFNFTGLSYAAALINAAAFGASLTLGAGAINATGTFYIDAVRITVTTTAAGAGAPQVVGEARSITLAPRLIKGDK